MHDAETPTVAASLRRLASSFGRDAWLISLCVTLAVITALLLTSRREPRFDATSRLVVGSSGDLVGASGGAWTQSATRTVLNLLGSDVVLTEAAREARLRESGEGLGRRLTATAEADSAVIVITLRDRDRDRATRTLAVIDGVFIRAVADRLGPIPAAEDGSRAAKPLVRVFDPPHAGTATVGTPTLFIAILAGFVGAGLGACLSLLRDSLRRTRAMDVQELEHILGAPRVAVVPPARAARAGVTLPRPGQTARVRAARHELLRHLRVTWSGEFPGPRVVIVVSATAGEGVDHVCAETALALAQAGHAVVSVDGDLAQPSVHRRLPINGPLGRLDGLSAGTLAAGTPMSDLQPTAVPLTDARGTLHHLAGGPLADGTRNEIAIDTWRRIVGQLEQTADWIVIASRPLNASMTALDLVDVADDVLLVVSARTARDTDRNALRQSLAGRAGLRGAMVVVSQDADIRRLDGSTSGPDEPNGTAFTDIPVVRADRHRPPSARFRRGERIERS